MRSFSRITPDNLENLHFKKEIEFSHQDVISFVLENLGKSSLLTFGFWTIFLLILIGGPLLYLNSPKVILLGDWLAWVGYGMLLFILWIPVHELIHGIAYKVIGAPKVEYKMNLKKGYFLAIAPQFVAGPKDLYFAGSLPFIVISLFHLLAFFNSDTQWQVIWWSSLIMHTLGCLGDLAILNYFFINSKHKELVTYDSVDGKTVILSRSKN